LRIGSASGVRDIPPGAHIPTWAAHSTSVLHHHGRHVRPRALPPTPGHTQPPERFTGSPEDPPGSTYRTGRTITTPFQPPRNELSQFSPTNRLLAAPTTPANITQDHKRPARAIRKNPPPAPLVYPQEIVVQYPAVECSWAHFSTPELSRFSPPGTGVKHGAQSQRHQAFPGPRPCHASPPTHTSHPHCTPAPRPCHLYDDRTYTLSNSPAAHPDHSSATCLRRSSAGQSEPLNASDQHSSSQ
jgi:hypothetical protein